MNSTNSQEHFQSTNIEAMINGPIYQAYSYSYPHKTSYRAFDKPESLKKLWDNEKQDSLFLYIHLPFCEMRCGFCNLFTLVRPEESLPNQYLDTLERQVSQLATILAHAKFARFAIGGGTPTYLSAPQLDRLFSISDKFNFYTDTPIAIESSPSTIDRDKIRLLEERGITRISMGVQSFTADEIQTLARRQDNDEIQQAIEIIRNNSQADLNLDLIYGIAGQTVNSWLYSVKEALKYKPEELYLYPLYVREKTGLGVLKDKKHIASDLHDRDQLALYRAARELLLAEGYEQISMRMFRRINNSRPTPPVYSCQADGMLGLGAGARSYTSSLHYSSEYAVGRKGVKDIIEHYITTNSDKFLEAQYGIKLDLEEQKIRFVLQSLLMTDGLDTQAYKEVFKSDCLGDFPHIQALIAYELAEKKNQQICLTVQGFEYADSIGPWLASDKVKYLMEEYNLK